MTPRRNIEAAFEIARVFVYGDGCWRDCAAWCSGCESYVPMVTLLSAATLENTSVLTIFRRIETGELHHKATADGELLACLGSLLNAGQSVIASEAVSTVTQ